MSARTYNILFVLWISFGTFAIFARMSDAKIMGAFIIAFVCSAAGDILNAANPPEQEEH
ncbi:hypothetical protein [Mesorhizobium sp.]|uniref:hypothetical protein n=1 Tax=Mesorhizobium sp. TaxID=1871066 RepID=UPI00257A5CC7|nr:hypothetical protein [Mesorhizobium sp.]